MCAIARCSGSCYHQRLRASEVGLLQLTDVDLREERIVVHRLKDFRGVHKTCCNNYRGRCT
jgi:hypothetical protein